MANDPVHDLLEQCCVQIRSAAGVGSGFFVAPKTVVTCAHVLGKGAVVGSSAELRLGGRGGWLAACVTAIAPADEDDLAVLTVDAEVDVYPTLDADGGVRNGDELLIYGFPKFWTNEPQRAVLLSARYESRTGLTQVPDRVLHMFSKGRVAVGYSGSPALDVATGKVIGIVSETVGHKAEAGGWAIPSALLATLFPDVAAANVAVASSRPWRQRIDARQEELETRSPLLPRLPLTRYAEHRSAVTEEIDYLNPYTRAVPLIGRQPERDQIRQWLNTARSTSIAVWTGSVGSGKTRLALEAVEEAAADGWEAGFLEGDDLGRFRQTHGRWVWRRPTFVVIDSAADHAALLAAWFAELAQADRSRPALRILLLNRDAEPGSGWWQTVFETDWKSRAVSRFLDPDRPVRLSQIADAAEQHAILDRTLDALGSAVRPPAPGTDLGFDEALSLRHWTGEPLFLIMAAMMASREKIGNLLSLRRTDLAEKVAKTVERARIEKIAGARQVKPSFLVHMAAYVTLCRGLDHAALLDAIDEERTALRHSSDDTDTARVAEALQHALPSSDGAVASIRPDMIAEAFVLTTFDSNQSDAVVFRAGERAPADVAATILQIGQDYVLTERLADAQRWFRTIVRHGDRSLPFLQRIADMIPPQTSAFTDEAAWIAETIVSKLRALTDDAFRPDLAMSLNNLGNSFDALGRREEALAVTQEAVNIRRELVASRPDAFRPALAGGLNNLGNSFDALGRREEALAVTQEAADIYRELAASRPDTFRPDLAMSLNNLGIRFDALGRREEALAVTQEAVNIRRELAASRPEVFRPKLANSLNNLSIIFTALGRTQEAARATEEAAALLRETAL